jgi:hypothetical protein
MAHYTNTTAAGFSSAAEKQLRDMAHYTNTTAAGFSSAADSALDSESCAERPAAAVLVLQNILRINFV